ncbi:MAG TPA: hypothetical protein VFZ99_05740 [Terriglobales bacterium]
MTRAQRTRLLTGAVALAVAAVLAFFIYLRGRAAPEVARLLPEADTILYFNLRPLRLLTDFGKSPLSHEAEYEDFVRQTGFQFERDLNEAAFAVHHSTVLPGSAKSEDEDSSRYSEVFTGRFDSEKVAAYLQKLSASMERYRAHDVYGIPYEDRVVRVSILSPDMVAISNTADPAAIHYMIDQYERSAWPLGGPSVLARYYHEVPFGSLAWLIRDVPQSQLPGTPTSSLAQLLSQFLGGGAVVTSIRYTTALHLRFDSFVTAEQSTQVAGQLNTTLKAFRDFDKQTQPGAPDPELEAALDSIKIEPHHDRVSITATLPHDLLTKLFDASIAGPDGTLPQAPAQKQNPPRRSPGRKNNKKK